MIEKIRLAYLLQVHKNPVQLNKFIGQITAEGPSDIYIHIDKKNVGAISPLINSNCNIKIMEESVDVRWGDISQVDATLCMLRSLKKSRRKYDFVCLKSGQDLKVRNGLGTYLAGNKDKIFMPAKKIESGDQDTYFYNMRWPGYLRARYDSMLHPNRILRAVLIRLYKRRVNLIPNPIKLPENYSIYRGSQWFVIPGHVAEYIVDYLEKNPWYYEAFMNALAPDEYFFQTIIMNSPFAANIRCDNLTYIRSGLSYRDSSHPVTLSMQDISEIERSGKFFARKFDEAVDREVVNYFCKKCGSWGQLQ